MYFLYCISLYNIVFFLFWRIVFYCFILYVVVSCFLFYCISLYGIVSYRYIPYFVVFCNLLSMVFCYILYFAFFCILYSVFSFNCIFL